MCGREGGREGEREGGRKKKKGGREAGREGGREDLFLWVSGFAPSLEILCTLLEMPIFT